MCDVFISASWYADAYGLDRPEADCRGYLLSEDCVGQEDRNLEEFEVKSKGRLHVPHWFDRILGFSIH